MHPLDEVFLWHPYPQSPHIGIGKPIGILADLQGVVRWGGDTESPKESVFFIDVPPGSAKLALVAETLRQWNITPGKGAGTQNIEDPKRIKAAKKLASMQAA